MMLSFARVLLLPVTGAVVFGFAVAHAQRYDYSLFEGHRVIWAAMFVLVVGAAAYAAGLPDLPKTRRQAALSATIASASAALAISLIQLFLGDQLLPRFVVLGSAVVLVPFLILLASLSSGGLARAQRRDRVLVVADEDESKDLLDEFLRSTSLPAQIVAVLPIKQATSRRIVPTEGQVFRRELPGTHAKFDPRVLPQTETTFAQEPENFPTLTGTVISTGSTILVLSRRAQMDDSILAQAAEIHATGVRVRSLVGFYEEWLHKLPVAELEHVSLFFDIRELHAARYRRVKRLLDVSVGLAGMAFLAVACPVVLLGNLIGNRGPLFFRQVRVGKGGEEFTILKFRTMAETEDEKSHGRKWTQRQDVRITPFGRILRRSHLDELPQLVNLLKGNVSVVGPRPEQPEYVNRLSRTLPYYQYRHLVRPGLTGWAQVSYGYGDGEAGALEKLRLEFYYLRNQSLWLDLRIIGRTLRSVLRATGR